MVPECPSPQDDNGIQAWPLDEPEASPFFCSLSLSLSLAGEPLLLGEEKLATDGDWFGGWWLAAVVDGLEATHRVVEVYQPRLWRSETSLPSSGWRQTFVQATRLISFFRSEESLLEFYQFP